jgi:tetratricopeptide (TPR) repeat protein
VRSRDSLIAAALGVAFFIVYLAGACRTIYAGDSGELVTAVAVLGIPHPSGYPLYVLTGKLLTTLLPVGSIAFRMSIFSALCAAAACSILYLIVVQLTKSRLAGVTSALLLAFSGSFWGEANIQRVYSLNALFVAVTTLLVYRWLEKRDDRLLIAAFFTCALGAANHTFMAVYGIALLVFAFASDRALIRRLKTILLCGAAGAIGLLPYAYLPIRSRMNPTLDWGNPETLQNFLKVVSRSEFWDRRWYRGAADLLPIGWDLLRSFASELMIAGVVLVILGVVASFRKMTGRIACPPKAVAGFALLIIFANFLAMAFHGSRSDLFIWHRYYIPAYLMAALLAGLGTAALLERIPRKIGYAVLAIPLTMLILGYRANDRSRYRIAQDFSETLLSTLPPGSTLIASDDNILFVLMYLLYAEHRRPDVDLVLEGVGGADLPPLRFDPDVDPVFLTHHPNWQVAGLEVVPLGLAFRTWRTTHPPPEPPALKESLDGETDARVPKDYLTQNLVGHYHYMLGVTNENRDWLRARQEFGQAIRAAPDNDVMFYNLGLIFARNGLFDDAIAMLERSRGINPRDIVSAKKTNAGERLELTMQERDRVRRIEERLGVAMMSLPAEQYHLQMSARLMEVGEDVAARGHRLRAIEVASNATTR